LKGVLPMLVLVLLDQRESYGYELVRRLEEAGLVGIATGTVYPVLARLERDGLISSRLVASPSGPARKYYLPTPYGRQDLADSIQDWTSLVAVAQQILHPAPTPADP
ncbi:MAG TPA: PadR family transcriptional regulator, partial [Actinotalea sp.]|nr:PadR family transcriptional regulator [Actinotalea sp.]